MPFVKYKVKDYAEGQLLAGISTGALSLQLKSGQGAKFPSFGGGEKAIGTLEKRTWSVVTARERVTITARSTDTFTITRSFGGDTAIAFSADDYFCLHVNADVIGDMQDEISTKLASAGWLRTALTNWRLYYSNGSGAETELALWSANTYLKSNGASSAPSWVAPPLDIAGQTEIAPVPNDYGVFYDTSGTINAKALLWRIAALVALTFGNGSDGNVTISGTVTLTRDMYYNDLTIPGGTTLNPNGFRVFVKGILSGSWNITRNGNAWDNASGATAGNAGAVLNQWSLNAEVAGWNGAAWYVNLWFYAVGAAWSNGSNANPSLVNVNGVWWGAWWYAGSASSGGTSTRGALYNILWFNLVHPATAWSTPTANYLSIAWSGWWWSGATNAASWSSGGWGWAGGNGGCCLFAVNMWNFTGIVSLVWGVGGNGGDGSGFWIIGWWGWGWGGNGWTFIRIYGQIIGSATFTLTGGNGGAGGTGASGNGAAWTNGNAGTLIDIQV